METSVSEATEAEPGSAKMAICVSKLPEFEPQLKSDGGRFNWFFQFLNK